MEISRFGVEEWTGEGLVPVFRHDIQQKSLIWSTGVNSVDIFNNLLHNARLKIVKFNERTQSGNSLFFLELRIFIAQAKQVVTRKEINVAFSCLVFWGFVN